MKINREKYLDSFLITWIITVCKELIKHENTLYNSHYPVKSDTGNKGLKFLKY